MRLRRLIISSAWISCFALANCVGSNTETFDRTSVLILGAMLITFGGLLSYNSRRRECVLLLKVVGLMSLPYLFILALVGHGFHFDVVFFRHSVIELARILNVSLLLLVAYFFLPTDEILLWMLKRAPRLALVFALSARSIPRLYERFQLTVEGFAARGISLNEGPWRTRAVNLYQILRSVLLSTLDECDDVTVSCQLHGFIGGQR